LSDEIVLGTWGNVAQLIVIIHENKIRSIKIVSTEKILRDRYGNLLLEREQNSFMKAELVSEKENGKWVFNVRTKEEIEEIFRKLAKRGILFSMNPLIQKFFSTSKEASASATDIIPVSDFSAPA
jgi:hypothetical protein